MTKQHVAPITRGRADAAVTANRVRGHGSKRLRGDTQPSLKKKTNERKVDDIKKSEMSVKGRSKRENNIVQSRLIFLTTTSAAMHRRVH